MDANPAIACIELSSIARGVMLLDVIVKRAAVHLVHHGRHSRGKYIIVFRGGVAEVDEAHRAGLDQASGALLGEVFLPNAHPRLVAALGAGPEAPNDDALLLVEMTDVWCAIAAADATIKLVDARLVDLQLASGIGGKGYFAIQAPQYDIEAASDLVTARFSGQLVEQHVLARPHEDILAAIGHIDPFGDSHH